LPENNGKNDKYISYIKAINRKLDDKYIYIQSLILRELISQSNISSNYNLIYSKIMDIISGWYHTFIPWWIQSLNVRFASKHILSFFGVKILRQSILTHLHVLFCTHTCKIWYENIILHFLIYCPFRLYTPI
jgi:sensor histidine kinase YesM